MADMRPRLEKLIGMLGSDYDGERANAAMMIRKLAEKEGRTLAELLLRGGPAKVVYQDRIVYRDKIVEKVVEKVVYRDRPSAKREHGVKAPLPQAGDRIAGLEFAWTNKHYLTEWELGFVADTLDQRDSGWPWTDRQKEKIDRIIRKCVMREIADSEDIIG